jgi:hypothetical protein
MSVSGDYSQPVYVNGYPCMNCSQVAEAKQGVDPAHPASGPYGITAKTDPTATSRGPAVSFGGALAGNTAAVGAAAAVGSQTGSSQTGASGAAASPAVQSPLTQTPYATGGQLNITV